MISAEQFLAILQEKDLLPPDLIERVRRQLQQAEKPPTLEVLAEQLIQEGLLTPALARWLIEHASAIPASPAKQVQPEPDELGLAPLDDELRTKWKSPSPPAAKPTGPEDSASSSPPGTSQPPKVPSLLEEELKPLGGGPGAAAGGPLDRLMADPLLGGAAGGLPLGPPRSGKKSWRRLLRGTFQGFFKRKQVIEIKPVNPAQIKLTVIAWGMAVLLILGTLVGISYLLPLTPDQTWRAAQDAYESGQYAQAIEQYDVFLKRFPEGHRASEARVRRALARLHLADRAAPQNGGAWRR